MKPQLLEIELDRIQHSKTNPPERIASNELTELAASIRTQGVLEPLLVRPAYCVGARSAEEIAARRGEYEAVEIIAGARRREASQLAGLPAVPCLVREMDDGQAIEAQVVENLQRRNLTPLQEAQNYEKMMAIVEPDGSHRYTVERLAERLGVHRTEIYQRMSLLDLPQLAKEALAAGLITTGHGVQVARIPDPAMRAEAAKEVVQPQHKTEPLTVRETKELIASKYMRGLKGAPFKLDDATLVTEAGACSVCPHMTDTCAHLFGADETDFLKKKSCCNPGCYRGKVDAVYARQAAEAEKAGKVLLGEKESRAVYPAHCSAGDMDWDSRYVEVSAKPDESLLKPEVEKVGSWRKLVEEAEEKTGAKVPRVIARDQAGAPHELVDRSLAIAAIEKAGEPIFRTNERGHPKAEDEFSKQRKKEQEETKKRLAVTVEALAVVHRELVSVWHLDPVWDALFDVALGHAGADGLWLFGKWQGIKFGDGGADKEAAVLQHAQAMKPTEKQALVPLLLVSAELKWNGVAVEGFVALAEGVSVDLTALSRVVTQRLKDEKAAKKVARAKKKEPKAAPVSADALASAPVEKDEASALAQMVRAYDAGAGMSPQKLAETFAMTIEDVCGALELDAFVVKNDFAQLRQCVEETFTGACIHTKDIRDRTTRFACKGKAFEELTTPEELRRVLEMLSRKVEQKGAA